jgi:N utilization substance protein B
MIRPERRAREAALQILYLWEVGGTEPQVAVDTFFAVHQPHASDAVVARAADFVRGVIADAKDLDGLIAEHSTNWRLERLAVMDRLVLRLGVWELRHMPDTPAPVVIDEAIDLARRFGTDQSPKFVNGVLDAIRKTLAHVE